MTVFEKISESFSRQCLMKTLNAELLEVEDGLVKIRSTFQPGLSQQNGFFHAGVLTSIVDSACGYAALSKMPEYADVLTIEFKVNFMRPALPESIIAVGKMLSSGRTISVCDGFVYDASGDKLLAKMTATLITVLPK